MKKQSYGGLWPVMITPFTDEGEIDYASLERLIAWYEQGGATGLFAACQSSEIFYLSLQERTNLVRFVKDHAHIPVIASGHVSYGLNDQANELQAMCDAGADALIFITNRLCDPSRRDGSILPSVQALMEKLPNDIPLGFYECPYPFKRLISDDELKWCADSGRFAFMKDTCCDMETIRRRLEIIKGTPLQLFNANTTTLLDSLRAGAAGFSGVMMNFHIDLYSWLIQHWEDCPEKAELLQSFLTIFSLIERQYYPVNAKYHLKDIEHVLNSTYARTLSDAGLTETFRKEVQQMNKAADFVRKTVCTE